MTGACIPVQTPAGRIVPWSPETAETRGRGDTATRRREQTNPSPRRRVDFRRRVSSLPLRRPIAASSAILILAWQGFEVANGHRHG